ncbi:MAG: sugar ABC transporter ATP-binding protein [Clostridiaceae bacterium]|nr:sugar ABC transporter ATP-binding protein [Clostridiaceae bacterium]
MENRLEMKGITKSFGGVHALTSVNFSVRPGEIHALIGENGAGKSTLMRILSGACNSDCGEIVINGRPASIKSPMDSVKLGVAVIYQEYALATDLTVAENIFLDNITTGGKIVNWKRLERKAQELLAKLNFSDIDVNAKVSDFSMAYQQVVEICKGLSKDISILALDEPTALLSNKEVDKLFELLITLKDRGVSIIYISHRLEEIFQISDRISVLKDGCFVGTVDTADTDKQSLVGMMVGRNLNDYYPKREVKIGDVIFEVNNLNSGKETKNVSFNIRSGEILGLYGLVGSGRTETALAIFGLRSISSGEIFLEGKKVEIKNPKEAFRHGIGYLSEDRKHTGLLLDMSIKHNITLSAIDKFTSGLFSSINLKEENNYALGEVEKLAIHTNNINNLTSSLSGGNQQKVAIAKVLAPKCKVIIMDEPTRGVDVGSKREIYHIMNMLLERGCAILMISSEMEEIIGMCDRVLVMHEGTINGELDKSEINETRLISLAMEVD